MARLRDGVSTMLFHIMRANASIHDFLSQNGLPVDEEAQTPPP
jgi:hypothetical protein